MLSPGREHFDEVRRRVAEDSAHTFAQHLQRLLMEKEVELHPLPGNPTSDEDRHRWIAFLRDTKFLSYVEAAGVFTNRILPQLRRAADIRAEQAELGRQVAEAQAQPERGRGQPHIRSMRAERQAAKAAARDRRAALSDNTPATQPATVCACCASATELCGCKGKVSTSECSCHVSCPQCAVLKCDGLKAEARFDRRPTSLEAA